MSCFHCGQPIPAGLRLEVLLDGAPRAMCCNGCVAVAQIIAGEGLSAYYRFRAEAAANPEQTLADGDELRRYDMESLQRSFVRREGGGISRVTLSIEGLRCAACVWLLERHLSAQEGVVAIDVQLASERAELAWKSDAVSLSSLLAAFRDLGYAARPYRPDWQEEARRREYRSALERLVVAGLGAMQVMMYAVGLYAGALEGIEEQYRTLLRVVSALVAAPVLVFGGRPFFTSALRDLRNGRIGMDVPVALALAIAFTASLYATATGGGEVWFDSVTMFVFFLSAGRFVEMRARQRAAMSVEAALRRPPETATRLDAAGATSTVPVLELVAGDRLLVRPGETFPVDGRVLEGAGWVNEAMLTGEHWPRDRRPGDEVAGGTQNGESPLVVLALRTGADTAWASIVRMVDAAGEARPRLARLADRVARVFVPAVLVVSAATALAWWRIDAPQAFWVALSVLVITCPCALSLATPAALTAASRGALRRGVLLRSGQALEVLQRVTDVVFDKTGTLTFGRLRLRSSETLGARPLDECLALAAALERWSEHPVARAFDAVFDKPGGAALEVRDAKACAGAGVEGEIGGRRYRIGSARWVAEGFDAPAAACPADGILLGSSEGPLCRFEFEDALRPGIREAVAALAAQGLGVHLLSGDSEDAVRSVAAAAGIGDWTANASPAGKLERLGQIQAAGRERVVLVVGDGVNDAPMLGAAHVSLAMAAGSDLSRASADAVLLSNDPAAVVALLELSRDTRRVMRQNLGWSLVYNFFALPLACAGLVTPWWAAIGMSASSIFVVLNALRLGRGETASSQAGRVRKPAPEPRWTAAGEVAA